jgi:hypothetical protein
VVASPSSDRHEHHNERKHELVVGQRGNLTITAGADPQYGCTGQGNVTAYKLGSSGE